MEWNCCVSLLFALLVGGSGIGETARILAFLPFPAKSHQALFTPVLRELANRGHEVVAYVPMKIDNPPPTYKEVLVPNILDDLLKNMDLIDMSKMNWFERIMSLWWMGTYFQENMCNSDVVKDLIRSDQKFDVVLLESFFVQESFTALQHKFGAIGIEMVTFGGYVWPYDLLGNPVNPAYMPEAMHMFTDSMSFVERLQNTLMTYTILSLSYNYYLPKVETVMNNCFNYPGSEARPRIADMLTNKSLLLENSHVSLNYAMAHAPHVVSVGGLNVHPRKPLPKNIQKFMDEAKDGVIYFSLGSNLKVSDVAKGDVFNSFISVFGKLRQRVLWKWEKEEFPNRPANVMTSKWFPQQDILAHKNCKLFITHGGFLSLTEATALGVPVIGIPFFGDQPKNMNYITNIGLGIQLDPQNLTEKSIAWAIDKVMSNPSYKEKAMQKSKLFNDRPMSQLETAVYWIEYVIRHKGAPHLRPALAKLPWYQAMLLDVGAVILSAVLAVLLLTYLMFKKCLSLVCGRKSHAPVKKVKSS